MFSEIYQISDIRYQIGIAKLLSVLNYQSVIDVSLMHTPRISVIIISNAKYINDAAATAPLDNINICITFLFYCARICE